MGQAEGPTIIQKAVDEDNHRGAAKGEVAPFDLSWSVRSQKAVHNHEHICQDDAAQRTTYCQMAPQCTKKLTEEKAAEYWYKVGTAELRTTGWCQRGLRTAGGRPAAGGAW